jgi:hypothetical protein
VSVSIKSPFLARQYAEAFAKWEEGNRLGREQLNRDRFFPSTDKQSVEGERQSVSPLGGKVW